MKLQEQAIYSGFRLERSVFVKELNSQAYEMVHVRSGARLLYLANDDDNKVFSISFRTPPQDSTGVAHICEHSVLCGSRKFPLKEPFVELVKGSLNTFLNAMCRQRQSALSTACMAGRKPHCPVPAVIMSCGDPMACV